MGLRFVFACCLVGIFVFFYVHFYYSNPGIAPEVLSTKESSSTRIIASASETKKSGHEDKKKTTIPEIVLSDSKPDPSNRFNNLFNERMASARRQEVAEQGILKKFPRTHWDHFYFKSNNESWSVVNGVSIVLDKKAREVLFNFGRYGIVEGNRSPEEVNNAKLLYNENQKLFVVLTGRIRAKLKNLQDHLAVSQEHHLKIESASPEINTFFLRPLEEISYSLMSQQLGQDDRIVSFYFEMVSNKWQKN